MPFLPPNQQCQSTEGEHYASLQEKSGSIIRDILASFLETNLHFYCGSFVFAVIVTSVTV